MTKPLVHGFASMLGILFEIFKHKYWTRAQLKMRLAFKEFCAQEREKEDAVRSLKRESLLLHREQLSFW